VITSSPVASSGNQPSPLPLQTRSSLSLGLHSRRIQSFVETQQLDAIRRSLPSSVLAVVGKSHTPPVTETVLLLSRPVKRGFAPDLGLLLPHGSGASSS
jgi:hypothetical protein